MRDVDVPARRGIRFPGSIVGMPPMRDADGSIDAEAGLGGIEETLEIRVRMAGCVRDGTTEGGP